MVLRKNAKSLMVLRSSIGCLRESWRKENSNIPAASTSTVDVTQFTWKPTWSILFVLGISYQLPWEFLSTTMEEFKTRLDPDDHGNFTTTTVDETKLQEYFNPSLTFINFSSLLIFSGLVSALHQRISECIRIIGSLVVISLLLGLVTVLIFIPALDKMPHIFFGITLVTNFQLAAFAAVLRSSLTSIVGVFPQEYTVPLLSGQGMAGIFAALSKIITLLMHNSDLRMNSLTFFMIAILFELNAIICYIIMRHLSLYKYYFGKVTDRKESQFVQEKCETVFEDIPMDGKMEQKDDEQPDMILVVLKQIWPMALNICCIDVVKVSLFPAICADVRTSLAPANSPWDKLFGPVGCFLMNRCGNFVGRMLTAFILFPRKNSSFLPLLVAAQTLFIPLIIFCNVSPRSHTSPFFQHDAWFIFFNTLLGFCNGYFTTLLTSYGPKMAPLKNAKTAGSLMVFSLSIGCIIGAALSFLIRWII